MPGIDVGLPAVAQGEAAAVQPPQEGGGALDLVVGVVLPGAEDADVGGVRGADVVTRESPAAGVAAGRW